MPQGRDRRWGGGRDVNIETKGIDHVHEAEEEVIGVLARALEALGPPDDQPRVGRASAPYDHVGAKLADTVLQAGVAYERTVRPRVERILAAYPEGKETTGFLRCLESEGAKAVLNIGNRRKHRTIFELTRLLAEAEIETGERLRKWL